jgi:DNA-binding CsgD family transcriptional regulator/PAS domain-containing protein
MNNDNLQGTAAFDPVIDLIYDAASDDGAWPNALAGLAAFIGAEAVALLKHDYQAAEGCMVFAVGVRSDYARRYSTEFAVKNPWLRDENAYQPDRVFLGESIIPNSRLVETEFYREYLRPQGLLHSISGVLCRTGQEVHFVSGLRDAGRQAFGDRNLGDLSEFLPHMRRAFQIHRELARHRSERMAFQDLFDHLSAPVLLVDAQARPTYINRAAEQILTRKDGLALIGRKLAAASGTEHYQLMRCIGSAAANRAPRGQMPGGRIAISRPSGLQPYQAIVLALAVTSQVEARQGKGMAAVVIKDPEPGPTSSIGPVAQMYGFTPAEARLATLILDGCGLFEAAKRLSISKNTARTHMKRIYAKSGTHRQVEFVLRHATMLVDDN